MQSLVAEMYQQESLLRLVLLCVQLRNNVLRLLFVQLHVVLRFLSIQRWSKVTNSWLQCF